MTTKCDKCGYGYHEVKSPELANRIRAFGPLFRGVLVGVDPRIVHRRPAPDEYSAIENVLHVADVMRQQHNRIWLMLVHDEPEVVPVPGDDSLVNAAYQNFDLETALDGLTEASTALADAIEDLRDEEWSYTAVLHFPYRSVRNIDWVVRDAIHEGVHHLIDTRRSLTP
ncbi:DinB family protein [Polymorphospora rubra]|uniref:DinB-like domain-containing protein n=1 Tax=Polymorphospora rubra TaxID=338584 RepID=A0A810MPA8_9ACTN|nr:DinB family protein [Polymorphospora rubra]BCJ63077.1 hypothetical protein Prubr_00980 [Polymorphospora rubra]